MAKLACGDLFPKFVVNTQFEENTTIEKIADGKPLMLVVLRYIGCTSCRYDVHVLQQNYQKFVEKGVGVAVVMQSPVSTIRRDLAEEPLSFPIISDPDYIIYNALEIKPAADMKELIGPEEDQAKFGQKIEAIKKTTFKHGDYEGIEEQLPAFFYLDAEGKVILAHYARSIADMPTAEDMLKM